MEENKVTGFGRTKKRGRGTPVSAGEQKWSEGIPHRLRRGSRAASCAG